MGPGSPALGPGDKFGFGHGMPGLGTPGVGAEAGPAQMGPMFSKLRPSCCLAGPAVHGTPGPRAIKLTPAGCG